MSGEEVKMSGEAQKNFVYTASALSNFIGKDGRGLKNSFFNSGVLGTYFSLLPKISFSADLFEQDDFWLAKNTEMSFLLCICSYPQQLMPMMDVI